MMPRSLPARRLPDPSWEHYELYRAVREALLTLPTYFMTETFIEGISATDIFTLNSALGATIENQVVATLNRMRPVWDPGEKYLQYSFVRQPQTFPDVLLRRRGGRSPDSRDTLMGIELKGWYLLAKEGEPSFRYRITANACAIQDLIVIVPWALNNVISGSPSVFTPYVESSRYAAEYRNYWWQNIRQTSSDTMIQEPENSSPYPAKSDQIIDRPVSDSGGNFGRFARTGIMDDYLVATKQELLCGISAEHWLGFFAIFTQERTSEEVRTKIALLSEKAEDTERMNDERRADALRAIVQGLSDLL